MNSGKVRDVPARRSGMADGGRRTWQGVSGIGHGQFGKGFAWARRWCGFWRNMLILNLFVAFSYDYERYPP